MAACYSELYEEGEVEICHFLTTDSKFENNIIHACVQQRIITAMHINTTSHIINRLFLSSMTQEKNINNLNAIGVIMWWVGHVDISTSPS